MKISNQSLFLVSYYHEDLLLKNKEGEENKFEKSRVEMTMLFKHK